MNTESEAPRIIVDSSAIEHLRIARKWSNFLSIVGFVIIAIMIFTMLGYIVVALNFPQDELVKFTSFVQVVPLAFMLVIYGIPIYYLYQFGKFSKIAISNYDSEAITKAFQYLKLHYRFMGILVIGILVFYIIAIIVMIMAFPFISSLMQR